MVESHLSPLSARSSLQGCFQRLYHTSNTTCRPARSILQFGSVTRTLWGDGCYFVSPGLGRASSGLLLGCRWISSGQRKAWQHRNKSVMLYGVALVILVTGFSYAA